jgi:hypothetical protein
MSTGLRHPVQWSKSIVWAGHLVLLIAAASSVLAQDATTPNEGGSGGEAFTIGCGSGKALVGVQGRTGDHFPLGTFVNMIQPICVSVDAGGQWIGSPSPASAKAGVNQGEAGSLMCSSGWAVSGISGRSGIYVDQLEIWCAPLWEYGHLGVAPSQSKWIQGAIGGLGGNYFGPLYCPDRKPGKGFTGRAHDWIDRVALVCNYPSTPPAAVRDLSTPFQVVGGNPVHGYVTLNATAPANGTQVRFSRAVNSDDVNKIPQDPFAANPITVAAGQLTGGLTFNTIPVPSVVNVTLAPNPMSGSVFRTFAILPPSLTRFSLSSDKTSPGGSVSGILSLNGAAYSGGVAVSLTSSDTNTATVAPTAIIQQGQTIGKFPINVRASNRAGCSVISASGVFAPPGSDPVKQATLMVIEPFNKAFTLTTGTPFSSSIIGTVTFPNVTKVPRPVTLVSSNPALFSVPPSLSVPAGAASVDFTITVQSHPPSGLNCGAITATDSAGDRSGVIFSISGSAVKRIG